MHCWENHDRVLPRALDRVTNPTAAAPQHHRGCRATQQSHAHDSGAIGMWYDALPRAQRQPDAILLERGDFLCNLYVGDVALSSFQQFCGYQPSLVGLPFSFVTPQYVEAHVEMTATRALSWMLRFKNFNHTSNPRFMWVRSCFCTHRSALDRRVGPLAGLSMSSTALNRTSSTL